MMEPLGHISEYGLEKLQTRRHYCVSVSYLAENEYQIPLYPASALTSLMEEIDRLRAALVEEKKRALEEAAKVVDDALVSGVHAVFKNGRFSHDELHRPEVIRSRAAAAIRSLMEKPE